MIYFCFRAAHGTHVPGNKTPLMCALCLTQGEKAAHAYIMERERRGGDYFEMTFFFFLTVRFICLLVENRCESLTMAALQHPFTPRSLFFCPDLLCRSDALSL